MYKNVEEKVLNLEQVTVKEEQEGEMNGISKK